ncbi:MAG: LysE family transporter, partial [Verrucomicrobia bacterium]|nr:LysE family transporter [Cytophagales bacterium]
FEKKSSNKIAFGKGVGLAMLNPQLLLFWFGVFVYVSSSIFSIDTLSLQIAFVMGTACGAFASLSLLAYVANRQKERIFKLLGKYQLNKIVGWLFISLALFKFVGFFVELK